MITLRPHQLVAVRDVDELSINNRFVLCVLPTGAGKSLTLAEYARRYYMANQTCMVFAHRDVLISQLSEALCKMNIPHKFICSNKARNDITTNNLQKFGKSFYDERSSIIVSSNPTFSARLKGNKLSPDFLNSVAMWIQDECHHLIADSILWGSCVKALVNARGLGFTATPIRGDKKGLGDQADGVFQEMSDTTNMFELIQAGMLSPYKVFIPPTNVDLSGVNVTQSGDYNQRKLSVAVDKREITGDAVEHYLRISPYQPAITFCVTIEHANHVAEQFCKAGISSRAVSSKTPMAERSAIMKSFEEGTILNLVNVDLLGEGYDCPAVTTVIMLRPTQSYSLFKQQFGRCLRTSDGKSHGYLIDHVGNVQYMMNEFNLMHIHDDPVWTLERQVKRKKSGNNEKLSETRICPECAAFYEPINKLSRTCPECNHTETKNEIEAAARILQEKSGELVELEVEAINIILTERAKVDLPPAVIGQRLAYSGAPAVARHSAIINHTKRSHAQSALRDKIQKWCIAEGVKTGFNIETIQREFEVRHGINIFKAQTLGERLANELINKIEV